VSSAEQERPDRVREHPARPDHNPSYKEAWIMAKPKNTTTPSAFGRRALLAGGVATLVTPTTPSDGLPAPHEPDPVLALWRDWRKLYAEAEAHLIKWLKAESLLVRTVGFPIVTVEVPSGDSFQVTDHESIEDLLGRTAPTKALRRRLHADLAAHQARWDAAAVAVGFDDLDARQDAARERADAVAQPLLKAPAGSLTGIAAKLTLILELGQPSPQDEEFPWPQLRSALADLQRLARIPALLP
jgi:hypothetical protein